MASYVAALGGCVEIVANFGDERIVIASGEPGMIAMGDGGMIAITRRQTRVSRDRTF